MCSCSECACSNARVPTGCLRVLRGARPVARARQRWLEQCALAPGSHALQMHLPHRRLPLQRLRGRLPSAGRYSQACCAAAPRGRGCSGVPRPQWSGSAGARSSLQQTAGGMRQATTPPPPGSAAVEAAEMPAALPGTGLMQPTASKRPPPPLPPGYQRPAAAGTDGKPGWAGPVPTGPGRRDQ